MIKTLTFQAKDVIRLLDRAEASSGQPHLTLVHDRGIYLAADDKPTAVYADGFGPDTNCDEVVDAVRERGFAISIPAKHVRAGLSDAPGAKALTIKLNSICMVFGAE